MRVVCYEGILVVGVFVGGFSRGFMGFNLIGKVNLWMVKKYIQFFIDSLFQEVVLWMVVILFMMQEFVLSFKGNDNRFGMIYRFYLCFNFIIFVVVYVF